MSADLLREAAALMRGRAEAARAGLWLVEGSAMIPGAALVLANWEHGPRRVATCAGSLPEGNIANAAHIAGMHPAVALAVADWLDDEADDMGAVCGCTTPRALDVACAYLGSES